MIARAMLRTRIRFFARKRGFCDRGNALSSRWFFPHVVRSGVPLHRGKLQLKLSLIVHYPKRKQASKQAKKYTCIRVKKKKKEKKERKKEKKVIRKEQSIVYCSFRSYIHLTCLSYDPLICNTYVSIYRTFSLPTVITFLVHIRFVLSLCLPLSIAAHVIACYHFSFIRLFAFRQCLITLRLFVSYLSLVIRHPLAPPLSSPLYILRPHSQPFYLPV